MKSKEMNEPNDQPDTGIGKISLGLHTQVCKYIYIHRLGLSRYLPAAIERILEQ